MAYYIFIQDNKLNGCGQCEQLTEGVINLEVEETLCKAYSKNPSMYIWNGTDIVLDPEYEAKKAQEEKERIGNLFLTGADVERGIYQAKGMDFEDIVEMVETMQFAQAPQVEGLDIKALKIELKANNFYRGNPYVSAIGALLGFTSEQLDKFFETNDYEVLLNDPQENQAESEVEPMNDPSLTHETEVFNLDE